MEPELLCNCAFCCWEQRICFWNKLNRGEVSSSAEIDERYTFERRSLVVHNYRQSHLSQRDTSQMSPRAATSKMTLILWSSYSNQADKGEYVINMGIWQQLCNVSSTEQPTVTSLIPFISLNDPKHSLKGWDFACKERLVIKQERRVNKWSLDVDATTNWHRTLGDTRK